MSVFVNCKPKESLTIDGSSTVFPISEAVVEEYSKLAKNVAITVGVSGTGGGFKKICFGEIDMNNASRPIKKEEVDLCREKGIELTEFPIALDGITIVINKKNNFFQATDITGLRKIYLEQEGKAKLWSDIDSAYPAEAIKIYSPGQDSGTFDYFSEIVLGKNMEMRSDVSISEDDNFLVRGVADGVHAVGFFGISYYLENQDTLKAVAIVNPKDGKAYVPNPTNVGQGDYSPLSRDLFIYVRNDALKQKKNVRDFVRFYLQNAERLSTAVGSVPQPAVIYTQYLENLSSQ